jgi:hypothetical protein
VPAPPWMGAGRCLVGVGPSERGASCAGSCTRRCKSCTRRLFLPAHDIPCTPHQAQPLTVRHRQSATEGPGADRRPTPPARRQPSRFTTSSAVVGGAVKLRGSAGPPFHSLGRASGGAREASTAASPPLFLAPTASATAPSSPSSLHLISLPARALKLSSTPGTCRPRSRISSAHVLCSFDDEAHEAPSRLRCWPCFRSLPPS